MLIGYRFGDSNHGITVPILKRLMDPSLYPGDVMVATAERFPTIFYRALALALPGPASIPAAFFILYVASVAATLAGAYRIGRWAGGPAAGVMALLFAFPVRIGLAGEALYRVAFSHSHVASALVIWAMVWFLEGRRLLPLLVLSLGAYNHVLYSAYVLVPMLLVVATERKAIGTRPTLGLVAAAVLPLLPIAVWSAAHAGPMTAEWLDLLRLRSSHHSFPSAFASDLPAAAALLALATLTLSRLSEDRRRLVSLFLVGVALQFAIGTVFTEYLPLKAVLQYQPHRSWRFLALLLQGIVAAGVVAGWREGGVARALAAATAVVMFVPELESLLPIVLVAQAAAGRPTPAAWARLLAAATLVFVTGWGEPRPEWGLAADLLPRLTTDTAIAAAALALLIAIGRERGGTTRRALATAAAAGALLWLGPVAYGRARARWEQGAWYDAQNWVRVNTPRSAVVLTPPAETGFRVFSERTVVGEWKDGTQQYFDDAFVREWGARMDALGGPGDRFIQMRDDELLGLANRYRASYIVLPLKARHPGLTDVYRNRSFVVYRAERR